MGNAVDLVGAEPCVIQTEADRVDGKLMRIVDASFLGVLNTREPFFLAGRNHDAVNDQRGRQFVIDGIDTENIHYALPFSGRAMPSRCHSWLTGHLE